MAENLKAGGRHNTESGDHDGCPPTPSVPHRLQDREVKRANLTTNLPDSLNSEMVETLVRSQHVRVERIVSTGQCSPDGFWYDQDEHEWVLVVKGNAKLLFDDGEMVQMKPGDHVLITAHRKHRVQWTMPDEPTVWLAVFYAVDDEDGK